MTDSENFISRWARLKQRNEATVAQPRPDTPAEEPFDPASLPSIESIVADTDISGFLQSRVPAELTRAALRQAWTSDPRSATLSASPRINGILTTRRRCPALARCLRAIICRSFWHRRWAAVTSSPR